MLGFTAAITKILQNIYNTLAVTGVILKTGDIEIGAVEIKDGATDARAVVSATDGLSVNPKTLPPGASTSAKQDTGNTSLATIAAKDFSTETTLAAVLAKIIAAPATEAKQDTLIAKDFATQTTLAAVLAKIIAAPATEAKQDTLIAKDFATQTTLAAILAKIIAAPATEAKQDTLIAKDFATQTTLAAILAKIITAPATEAKQDTLNAKDFATQTTLAAIKDTAGVKKITDALPAGEAHLGQTGGQVKTVGIEKTRPANTDPYAAGDVISESTTAGTAFTIANIVRTSGGGGWFGKFIVRTDKISITPRTRLHIYDTIPSGTVVNDNALAKSIYFAGISEIATVDLPAMVSGDTGSDSHATVQDVFIPFKLSGTDVSVILETLDAFTPNSGQKFYVEIISDVY